MKVSGRFPIVDSLRPSGSIRVHTLQWNGYWSTKVYGDLSAIPEVVAVIKTLLTTEKTPVRMSGDYFGVDEYKSVGQPPPDKVFYQEVEKIKVDTSYHLAKKNGEIAVSDYQTGMIKWTFSPGGEKSNVGAQFTRSCNIMCLNTRHGLYDVVRVSTGNAIRIAPNTAISGALAYDVVPYTMTVSTYPNFTIPEPSWLLNQFEISNVLVTEVTGEANRKTLDILTAAAELPGTLRSCVNACVQVLKMYRDAKKGEIRLFNKSKRVRLEYDAALRELTRAERNSELSKRRSRALRKQYKNTLKKQLEEIASAISSVWLTYRYGIMPNVYLIEDAFKTNESLKTQFFEFTSTEQVDAYGPGPKFVGQLNIRNKHFIKRKFKPGYGANLSSNLFTTAWELIPLSFVVDWFINVGNFISSLQPPSTNLLAEGSTYSWKCSGVMKATFDDGSSVICEPKVYKRNIINPQSYCGLRIDPDFSPVRQYDALALIWQIALKKHFKGI